MTQTTEGNSTPEQTTSAAPRRRFTRWTVALITLAVLIVVVRALAAASTQTPAAAPAPIGPGTYEIRGFLTVAPNADGSGVLVSMSDTMAGTGHARCWAQSKYGDIGAGTPVTVYDDEDTVAATGYLGEGRVAEVGATAPGTGSCLFPLAVGRVPVDSSFYQVGVAQHGTVVIENAPQNGVLLAFITLNEPAVGNETR